MDADDREVKPIFFVTADKTISHSGRMSWGTCNRKFQLGKTKFFYRKDREGSKALSFGKGFGTGIQALLAGDSLDLAFIKSALDCDAQYSFEKDAIKSNQSLAHCHEAIQSFYYGQLPALKNDWEVLDLEGLYGVELPFVIEYPNGTVERGYLDVVLRNKTTGEIIVLEIKTSGKLSVGTDADWLNSPQGIMYLVVLAYLLHKKGLNLNSKILFIEYNKPHKKYTIFPFDKPIRERVEFLLSVYHDVLSRAAQFKAGHKMFKSGKCVSYNRQCEYFGVCDLNHELEYAEVEVDSSKTNLVQFEDIYNYLLGELNASTIS